MLADLTVIFVYQIYSQNLHCKINIYVSYCQNLTNCAQNILEVSGYSPITYVHIKSWSPRIKPFTSRCDYPSFLSMWFLPNWFEKSLSHASVMVSLPENISSAMFMCCGDKITVERDPGASSWSLGYPLKMILIKYLVTMYLE